ncbi:hypothetical protein SAMN05421805_11265 [Saccharopolyspora antimicrobica]|uniref:Restriction endonuclease n=1 Tax=Saccharopolyspora antimicrobica TaxID=455193 RepID=A0A1I5G283_9PSEU|nr:hypothetical protein [Saccharopolyspora antimicrobica]RKT83961.1 hypothetical protein ATL45_2256 [Saccharopolyspora antimicrobica]SFO30080.1 hypothetical protein SAMN05421805_11265 [Saccharopolyspora antimicrobica]
MSEVNRLIGEISRLLATGAVSYDSMSRASDVYEGYIFSLLVDTASRHGARVHYEDVHGAYARELVFRTGPGQLYADSHPYTHAVIEFDGAPPLEVHLGVYVQGTSGVLHECDVLVLPVEEAELSRTQRIAPRGSQCVLVIECKYYVSSLGIGLARNFEGLRADIRTQNELFVSNTGSSSIVRYLDARKRGFERNVVPNSPQAVYLQAEVRKAFKGYLSKHSPSTVI